MGTQWTVEQTTLMVKMWEYGYNDTQISSELGGKYTREVVINEINRLGFTEEHRMTDTPFISIEEVYEEIKIELKSKPKEKKPTAKKEPTETKSVPKSKPTSQKSKPAKKDSDTTIEAKSTSQPKSKSESKPQLSPKPKAKSTTKSKPQPAPKPKAETKAPNKEPAKRQQKPSKHLSIMELTEFTCRWPFGDPQETDFHFCGNMVEVGEVYCLEHCIDAYQNYAARREEKAKEAEKQANAQT